MAVSSRESKELCSELDKIDSKFTQFESKLDTNLNQSSTILTEIQGISGQFDTILKLITDNHPMYQSNVQPGKLESIRIAIQTPTLDISSTPRIVMAVLNNRKIAIGSTTTGEYMSFKVNANSGNIEDLYKKEIPGTKIQDIINYDDTHLLIVSSDKYIYLWEHNYGKLNDKDKPKIFNVEDYIYGIALLDRANFVCCNETFIKYYNIPSNTYEKKELKNDVPSPHFTCEAILKVTNRMSDSDDYKIVVSVKYSNKTEDDGQLMVLNENRTLKQNVPGVFVTVQCDKGMMEIPRWNSLAIAFIKCNATTIKENKIILLSLDKFEKQVEVELGVHTIRSVCKFACFENNSFFVSNGTLTQLFENGDKKHFTSTSTQLQGYGIEFIANGKYFISPYHEETKSGKTTQHKFGITLFTPTFA